MAIALFGFERIVRFLNCSLKTTQKKKKETLVKQENTERRETFDTKVKIQRAYGGCLGDISRRRTRSAAKSCGEPQVGVDPQISEWSNPAAAVLSSLFDRIGKGTR